MKKVLLIVFITFFYTGQAQTQTIKIKLGIRAGFNYSNITELKSHYKFGRHGGIFGELALTKHYSLQPELCFSQQGAEHVESYNQTIFDPTVYGSYYYDIDLNYLSFVLVNKFTFADKIYLLVGPSIDFSTINNEGLNSNVDLSIVTGFGIKVTDNFSLETRFKKGVFDIVDYGYYKTSDNFFFGDYNTNILFQLGAIYTFNLK